jgi:hypothetical protein
MTRLQVRFRTILARYGELLGTGSAIVTTITPGRARTYVADTDLDSATRPIWIAYAAYDHPAVEGQTLAWRGQSLLVKRTMDVRLASATIARLFVLFTVASGGGGGGTTPPDPL